MVPPFPCRVPLLCHAAKMARVAQRHGKATALAPTLGMMRRVRVAGVSASGTVTPKPLRNLGSFAAWG
jgi:hypothetical protein